MSPFQEYVQEIGNYGASSSSIKGFAMTAETFADRHPDMLVSESVCDVEDVVIKEGTIKTLGRPLVIDDSVPEGEVKLLTQRDMDDYEATA